MINVTIVDKQGKEVPDAGDLLHFSITGNAKIIGVGNGDPSSHEADKFAPGDWQRRLFNGKCQVIIQSDLKPGMSQAAATNPAAAEITFSVAGAGLQGASLALRPPPVKP